MSAGNGRNAMKAEDSQKQPQKTFQGRFNPTAERLTEVTEKGAELLERMTDEDLGEFVECEDESLSHC